MKINSIEIENFQGLRNAALSFSTPIALVAGQNGTGKSSLQDAVRFALLGESGRVQLKKDLQQLVTEGARSGGITVDVDGTAYGVALPAGKGNHMADSPYLPYVLQASTFARADADTRRRILFDLTGCKPSREVVSARLKARKVDDQIIETVMPILRSGFPATLQFAEGKKTECRANWKAVTGEVYGEKKAEGWKATKTTVEGDVTQISSDLTTLDKTIGEEQQALGGLRATLQQTQGAVGKLAALRETAGKYARIQDKLNIDEAQLADWNAKVAEANGKAAGKRREAPLMLAGMAEFIRKAAYARPNDQQEAAKLVDLYDVEFGQPVADAISPVKIKEITDARDLIQRSVDSGKRDLAAADAAAAQIKDMEAEAANATPVDQASVDALQQRIQTLQASRKAMASQLDTVKSQIVAANAADEKTKLAAQHHAAFLQWSIVADAMAPDGIQNELLSEALAPVNKRLSGLTLTAGWGVLAPVQLTPGMEITFDGRAYGLLSESEQWRCDCVVSILIAELSGLRLVLLDRFDMLDLPGRNELFMMLEDLAAEGSLDSVIVCGTLKQAPVVDGPFTAFWVQDGTIQLVGQREAVAA